MKLTLQTQLLPSDEQIVQLEDTMKAFNAAADWLAGEAFALKSANKIALQKTHYALVREKFGLSAQMTVRCIAQVCEAYKRDKKIRPHFKPFASVPYDQRLMSFKGLDKVSILTMQGRIIVPFIMGNYQRERFTAAKGQSDLVRRKDGKWFLLITVDLPDGTPTPTTDFLGVDLGVANLATDSDGEQHSGDGVEKCRIRHHTLRKSLQRGAAVRKAKGKRPKQIRRRLKKLSGQESRYRKDINHCISKSIVTKAKDTGRGISLEDLKHIRERTRFRKEQRSKMSGWAFFQLRSFIAYKAQYAGIEVKIIDPRNTSRECSACGYIDKANRKKQAEFCCLSCGHEANADVNAAINISSRVHVIAPKVSEQLPKAA